MAGTLRGRAIMAPVTGWVEEVIADGGYVILAAIVFLENLFPPIPSELVLPLAGSRVASGDMGYLEAVLAATVGSVLGALVLYALGRFGGRPLLLRYGRLLRLDERRLDRAEAWFDQRGDWLVLLGRVIPGVRSVISVPAGLARMPLPRFVALTAIGSAVWNAALIGGGWALGARWRELTDAVAAADVWVVAGVLATFMLLVGVHLARRRRLRTAG
jgi:membrane protein DedA with SNARE-associated domain